MAREIEEELRFHIEMRTQANRELGMTPDEAREAALQRFGDWERIQRECCEIREAAFTASTGLKCFALLVLGVTLTASAMGGEYHNVRSVLMLLAAILVMLSSLVIVRAMRRTTERRWND